MFFRELSFCQYTWISCRAYARGMWNLRRKKVHTNIKVPNARYFQLNGRKKRKVFEYLDFMQCVSNSRRKILHTKIKIRHELKNARCFQFNGRKGKLVHHNYFSIFGFHAVVIEFKKEVVHSDIKVPHKTKKIHKNLN